MTSTTRHQISAAALIKARPQKVYAILADYHRHHPLILPKKYFRELDVREGGVGAGTRMWIQMHVLGTTKELELLVSEPDPGRVLVETNVDGSSFTRFTLDPADDGEFTHLTITTEFTSRNGLLGVVERLITSMMLRQIYREELVLLAAYANEKIQ